MPWIIADEDGNICQARNKVYNTERGAKMGYKAALDNWLQMWYLYDDDLDYHYYVQRTLNDDSFLGQLLTSIHKVEDTPVNEKRWNELVEQFESQWSIQEVTMSLQKA